MFDNINLDEFWDDNDYALKEYVLNPVSDHYIQEIEHELGYKLLSLQRENELGGRPCGDRGPLWHGTGKILFPVWRMRQPVHD